MDPIIQANQDIKNRIAALKARAPNDFEEQDRLIEKDPELKELKANRDALVRAQPVQSAQPGKKSFPIPLYSSW
jgi:hypothetical protein